MALKILMTTMSLDIGGAETHIVELASELKRRGLEVLLASNGGIYVPDIEKIGIRHYQVPMNRRQIFCMIKSYFLLHRIIKKEKPDIVHAHARIPAFLCGILRKTMHFPFVTTAHGVFQLGLGLNQLTNWGQKTIAVSEDIRGYLHTNYGLNERDIVVTINGIDTEKFSPDVSILDIVAEFSIGTSHPIVCHVSRLDESTSLIAGQLIEIAAILDRLLPGVQIIIAGGGDMFEQLKQQASTVNKEAGRQLIIMTGPRTDINKIIAVGDLFVGVSRAALEAMSSAKPVILAGNQGYNGLFCPEKLDEARASNFCCRGSEISTEDMLLGDILYTFREIPKAELSALGTYNRQLILHDYSVNRMTDDCQKVYEEFRHRRYNVVMSGYYGFGNAGDEAILQSIHQNIENSGGDISITVLSNDPEDTKNRYGYDAVNRFKFFSVLRALRRSDALVSGGGSLLQDHTSTRSLLYYLMIIYVAELLKKKIMIYANGIGPVRKKINRGLVRRIVGRADLITLRDEVSVEELYSMGIRRTDVRVTADPVFTLSGAPREEALSLLTEEGLPTDVPFVCVSVRNWNGMGSFKEKVAKLCDDIFVTYGRNILFIAMQTPHDVGISYDIQQLMHHKSYVLDTVFTAEQIMGIMGLSDFVIAMRLHALIFSARMGVPLIGMVYDPKVEAYITALDMLSAGDVEKLDPDKVMIAVKEIITNREKYVATLERLNGSFEELAREDALQLMHLMEKNN